MNLSYSINTLLTILQEETHYMNLKQRIFETPPQNGESSFEDFEDSYSLIRTSLAFIVYLKCYNEHQGIIQQTADAIGISRQRASRLISTIEEETHLSLNDGILSGEWPKGDGDYIEITVQGGVFYLSQGNEEEFDDESRFNKWAYNDDVIYNEGKDSYIYYSDKARKHIQVPGDVVREMKTDYSNQEGNFKTINQMARKYEIPRKYLIELKRKFGWTHDSSIYTEQELVEWDTEQIDRRAVEARERKALERAQENRFKEIEKKAKKFDKFFYGIVNPLKEAIEKGNVQSPAVKKVNIDKSSFGRFAATFCPMDLHFGKGSWSLEVNGDGYSKQEASDLLSEGIEQLISLSATKNPERIFLPIGHDFFHVTRSSHTTAHGTPQDMDGSYIQMIVEGCELASRMVDMIRQLAHVDIVWVPGNHDLESSMTVSMYLAAKYEDASDVDIHFRPGVRTYMKWGENLMGHVHGDAFKSKKLPEVMARELREVWGETKNSMWFTGHLHHEKFEDISGTQIFQAPTLCGKGRWDFKKGYGANRAMMAHMIHEKDGAVTSHRAPIKSESKPTLLVELD